MTMTWASNRQTFNFPWGRKVHVILGDGLETVIYILVYINFIIAILKVAQNAAIVCGY